MLGGGVLDFNGCTAPFPLPRAFLLGREDEGKVLGLQLAGGGGPLHMPMQLPKVMGPFF